MYRVCGRKGISTTELKSTEARQVQQKRMDDSYTVGNDVKPSHVYGDEKERQQVLQLLALQAHRQADSA